MIKQLLKKLTSKPNSIKLNSNLQSDCCFKKGTLKDPEQIQVVEVPKDQTCLFFQHDGEPVSLSSGSQALIPYFTTGQLDVAKPLYYCYIKNIALCEGKWSLDYTDHEQAKQNLSGNYCLEIDKQQRFAQFLLKFHNIKDERDFTAYVAQSIATILKAQRIPVSDIHMENVRFGSFLRDALGLALRPNGMKLQSLSLNIVSNQPNETNIVEKTTELADEQSKNTPTQNIIENVIAHETTQPEKLYYYVHNGEQQGPFSQVEIKQKIDDGILRPQDLLWKKGLSTWQPIAKFSVFSES